MNLRNIQIKGLCEIRMGHTFRQKPKYRSDGNKLVIQPGNVTKEGALMFNDLCRAVVSVDQNVKKGDVLLINRGRFTATVFDDSLNMPCVASSAFMIVTPKEPQILLPEYLALFFNSIEGQNIFKRQNETTTIPFVSCTNLGAVKISVPKLDKQRTLIQIAEETKAYIRLSFRKVQLRKNILNKLIADSTH